MFAGCIVEGVTIVFAPLGANLESAIREDSFTLMANKVNTATGRTSPGDVNDFDDVRRAQLVHTALLAQGVINGVEFLVDSEAAGSNRSGVGFGAVMVGVGTVRSRVGLRRSRVGYRRSGIRAVGFGRVRVSIMYCIHIHIYRV